MAGSLTFFTNLRSVEHSEKKNIYRYLNYLLNFGKLLQTLFVHNAVVSLVLVSY